MLGACGTSALVGPIEPQNAETNRQIWRVPAAPGLTVRAVVYRPSGEGRFPLAVISHGSSEDIVQRAEMPDPDYPELARWLTGRGFVVVVPQRPGHGQTGGPYLETAGTCENPDFKAAGLASASVLENVVEFMRTQPFVAGDSVLLIGHSAGGWASLALASKDPGLVSTVIVFAAGRGGRSNNRPRVNCAPDRLVAVAGEWGKTARAPVIWIYAENDSYFDPRLGRKMAEAYSRSAPTTFIAYPSSNEDGHFLVHEPRAVTILSPLLSRFPAATKSN